MLQKLHKCGKRGEALQGPGLADPEQFAQDSSQVVRRSRNQVALVDIRRYDKQRKNKRVSNDQWQSPSDPESRITKMKDGRTHLAYKAEHVVDLESELVVAAEVYSGNRSSGRESFCSACRSGPGVVRLDCVAPDRLELPVQ